MLCSFVKTECQKISETVYTTVKCPHYTDLHTENKHNSPDNWNTSSYCSMQQGCISRPRPVRFIRISSLRQKTFDSRHILTSHGVMQFRTSSRDQFTNIIIVTHSFRTRTRMLLSSYYLAEVCLFPFAFVQVGCDLLPPHGEDGKTKRIPLTSNIFCTCNSLTSLLPLRTIHPSGEFLY